MNDVWLWTVKGDFWNNVKEPIVFIYVVLKNVIYRLMLITLQKMFEINGDLYLQCSQMSCVGHVLCLNVFRASFTRDAVIWLIFCPVWAKLKSCTITVHQSELFRSACLSFFFFFGCRWRKCSIQAECIVLDHWAFLKIPF